MKKQILSLVLSFLVLNSFSQNITTYNLFTKELDKIIITVKVFDRTKIQVLSKKKDTNEKIDFTETLLNTSKTNIYYFKCDKFTDKILKGFIIAQFIENDSALCFFIEKSFNDKKQIEKFIANPINLMTNVGFLFVKNIELEDVEKMPTIRNISKENLTIFKERIVQRKKEYKIIPKEIESKKFAELYINYGMWLNMQCLLLGCKFPLVNEDYKWLVGELKK